MWICQCLCPARHMITGALDEADGLTDAERGVAQPLRERTARMLAERTINPWCGLCRAPRERWFFELAETVWETMEEAMPHIEKNAAEQALTGAVFGELLGVKKETKH